MEMMLYRNESFRLRTWTDGNETWFVARDVCDALGLGNMSQAISRLDDDEKGVITNDTLGGAQQFASVNEPGLYNLVLSSRKQDARDFKRWVTHEVLPSIRRTGGYMTVPADETPEQTMARALLIASEALKRRDERISELEPKARFADAVSDSDGCCLIGELAKMLRQNGSDIGQNRMFELLRRDGFLGSNGSYRNVPTQRAMDLGLFRIKETAVRHADGHVTVSRTPKVTGKGQTYLLARYSEVVA